MFYLDPLNCITNQLVYFTKEVYPKTSVVTIKITDELPLFGVGQS